MIDMHSKYDNMHKNEMFYTLICINNHVVNCINFTLLIFINEYRNLIITIHVSKCIRSNTHVGLKGAKTSISKLSSFMAQYFVSKLEQEITLCF